jgi:hypothetical protein
LSPRPPDTIICVSFLGERDPTDFYQFDVAFISLFRILASDSWAQVCPPRPTPQFRTSKGPSILQLCCFDSWACVYVYLRECLGEKERENLGKREIERERERDRERDRER